MDLARLFVLRRDAGILKKYLPPKCTFTALCTIFLIPDLICVDEYVVFITPTKLQRDIFQRILTRDNIDNISATHTAESLALINLLTKISNSPILLKATVDQARSKGNSGDMIKKVALEDAVRFIPERAQVEDVSLSGACHLRYHHMECLRLYREACRSRKPSPSNLQGTGDSTRTNVAVKLISV